MVYTYIIIGKSKENDEPEEVQEGYYPYFLLLLDHKYW